MAEKCLELKDIRKSFSKDEVVLKEISLSIDKGEFITLLGSSGCGKTTTLRIIAGLETPDSGKVYLEGKDVTALAPEARDVNTVFQNYALFPHMTVADNIGYGLKLKKSRDQKTCRRNAGTGTASRIREEKAVRTFRWTETACGNCPFAGQ